MDWNDWIGKRIFVQLKSGRVYTGNVLEIDDENRPIIFITILDKFKKRVTFAESEIVRRVEEWINTNAQTVHE